MIITKRVVRVGLEGDHETYTKKKEELNTNKENRKNTILDEMKQVPVSEVGEKFAEALATMNEEFNQTEAFYDQILLMTTEEVVEEVPDEEEVVDLDEENAETVE